MTEYVIPLRKEWLKTPKYKRAKKAVIAVRQFLKRHLKASDVKVGPTLNLELWKHGIKNPPSRIKVVAEKDKDGIVRVELVGFTYPVAEEVAEKGMMEKMKDKVMGKKEMPVAAPVQKPAILVPPAKLAAPVVKSPSPAQASKGKSA